MDVESRRKSHAESLQPDTADQASSMRGLPTGRKRKRAEDEARVDPSWKVRGSNLEGPFSGHKRIRAASRLDNPNPETSGVRIGLGLRPGEQYYGEPMFLGNNSKSKSRPVFPETEVQSDRAQLGHEVTSGDSDSSEMGDDVLGTSSSSTKTTASDNSGVEGTGNPRRSTRNRLQCQRLAFNMTTGHEGGMSSYQDIDVHSNDIFDYVTAA